MAAPARSHGAAAVPGDEPKPDERRLPPQMVWSTPGGIPGFQALSVWTEQVPGHGEDAEPFVVHHWPTHEGMIAVFDGSGGAGAGPVWEGPDGLRHTGAWVGSRVARLATECWFREVAREGEEVGPDSLHQYLDWFLAIAPQRRSKIGGTMRRHLPTTLAGVHYRVHDEQSTVELRPLWAGDSRAYVLTPADGLHVLTRDHTRESDALELLRTDPPMTNVVCADREFVIDTHHIASFEMPCVLIAATDGYFGYVHTPADFEYLLLDTLRQADNEYEWADLLRRGVQRYTGDDASLALLALGHQDFPALVAAYEQRFSDLTERYVRGRPAVLDASPRSGVAATGEPEGPQETQARVRAWQDHTWRTYRTTYENHLPPASEEYR
ncbi:serine/threonine protein phosphatase [Streptomyces sp. NPDC006553]|uniref:serine/threonine protein phosphatase n=1 Tax=unclassified Streptomyces TaxID=2593676 RepID=UPI00225868A3|nr:serine/threonine protein phosphatase [Streptomyces sp. NBC_00233]MCX5229376.1 serine/threonine protein phosphatase [Streptomyces sp. NBC_00233]